MTDSILLGKSIYSLLSESEELNDYVNFRIFPLIAETDTEFPFITFSRDSVYPSSNTKDGLHEDTCTFSVLVVGVEYLKTLEIANIIRGIFEKRRIISEGLCLEYTQLQNITEEYTENSYTQQLSFTTIVTNA